LGEVLARLSSVISHHADELVRFAHEVMRIESTPGQERELADVFLNEMQRVGFASPDRDAAGNVVGYLAGTSPATALMLNGHLDSVAAGPIERWPVDPRLGVMVDDAFYSPGATDTKCALVSMLFGMAAVRWAGLQLRETALLTANTLERRSTCAGMRYLMSVTLRDRLPRQVVIGEATDFGIATGTRGRAEIEVVIHGCPGSAARGTGLNAVLLLPQVIGAVDAYGRSLGSHPTLGRAAATITAATCEPGYFSDAWVQHSLHRVPATATLCIDRRFLPDEDDETLLNDMDGIVTRTIPEGSQYRTEVRIHRVEHLAYTGLRIQSRIYQAPWVIARDHPFVVGSRAAVETVIQRNVPWYYRAAACDASCVAGEFKIPTILFSPGAPPVEDTQEHATVTRMITGAVAYAALLLESCGLAAG